jgi:hypothetical protein
MLFAQVAASNAAMLERAKAQRRAEAEEDARIAEYRAQKDAQEQVV